MEGAQLLSAWHAIINLSWRTTSVTVTCARHHGHEKVRVEPAMRAVPRAVDAAPRAVEATHSCVVGNLANVQPATAQALFAWLRGQGHSPTQARREEGPRGSRNR